MKNWKRIAALAMSAVMVGGMLTGCGGGGGSTEAAKDNAPKAEAGADEYINLFLLPAVS